MFLKALDEHVLASFAASEDIRLEYIVALAASSGKRASLLRALPGCTQFGRRRPD